MAHVVTLVVRRGKIERIVGNCCVTLTLYFIVMYNTDDTHCLLSGRISADDRLFRPSSAPAPLCSNNGITY
jgi:hypothetical protein